MFQQADLAVEGRILGNDDKMIDGIEAEADRVELSVERKCKRKVHVIGWERGRLARNEREARKTVRACGALAGETPALPAESCS